MFNHLHLTHLNKKNIQILAFILLFPLFVAAQTEAERSKITSAYDQKAIAALKEKFQQAQNEREARIALYLQQNKVERTFSQNGVVFSLYDIGSNRVPIYTKTKNIASGQVINAHKLYNGGSLGLNIQGQGMVAGVWDTGPVRATHELLSGQATQIDGSTITDVGGRDHMAHVTGTIVGKALSNGNTQAESARGVAFNATARCYDSDNDLTEMTTFGGAGFLVSNHSYGYENKSTDPAWILGAYDVQARQWDMTVKTMPNYLPFVAGGNEQTSSANAASKGGYDVISGNSAAKNVMTVGAVNGDLTMSDYSNWGPTDDGRFKPEIVAKGTGINSAQSTADNAYSGNGENSSGTSYATPAVTGLALLLQQYHNSVKGSYLEAAGIKGLLLHTATDLGQPGPDYKFGWGLANGEKAAQTIAASNDNLTTNNSTVKIAKITTNPALGANVTYTLKAKGAGTPLSASICWTDDEGAEQVESDGIDPTTGRLVYNFDIKLVDQVTNQEYFPWKGPGMANRTQNATRTSANDVDNFKRVDIDAPVAGRNYQLVITKRNTSPSAARQFTIIWTGLESATVPVELLSFTGKHTEGGNLLTWQTANEVNNKGFEVERLRATGDSWVTIGFKTANNKAIPYNFTDNAPLSTSYYRLRQIDNDGKETLSKVVAVSRNSSTKLKVYPNPVSNVLTVENTEGEDFQILNLLGQQVLNGKAAQHIDVSALPQGAYFLKVGTEQVKFIKQ